MFYLLKKELQQNCKRICKSFKVAMLNIQIIHVKKLKKKIKYFFDIEENSTSSDRLIIFWFPMKYT